MKIVLFGSGGMVGSRIAAELAKRGHDLTGASRSTGADITDPAAVARIATGADAIVSAVSARGVDHTLADVARSLVYGARQAGVRRLVIVGGAGSLEVAPGVRLVDTPISPPNGSPKRYSTPTHSRLTETSTNSTGPSSARRPTSIPASAPVATGSGAISFSLTTTATAKSAPRTTRSPSPMCSNRVATSANASPLPGDPPTSPGLDPK